MGDERDPGRTVPFSPTLALVALARRAEAELVSVLTPLGLTPRTYGLLGHISAHPGLSLSELARRSSITVQSTHSLIRDLSTAGLVDSRVAAAGLAAEVRVTDAGRDMLTRAGDGLRRIDREHFASVGMQKLERGLRAAISVPRRDLEAD